MEPGFLDMLPRGFAAAAREMARSGVADDSARAAARKKRKDKKSKGDVFQRCKGQAADLRLVTEIACGDDAECLERGLACLGPLEICDLRGFLQCVRDVNNS